MILHCLSSPLKDEFIASLFCLESLFPYAPSLYELEIQASQINDKLISNDSFDEPPYVHPTPCCTPLLSWYILISHHFVSTVVTRCTHKLALFAKMLLNFHSLPKCYVLISQTKSWADSTLRWCHSKLDQMSAKRHATGQLLSASEASHLEVAIQCIIKQFAAFIT